ncbi:MAG: cupin domain-containing protein [Acidimicrobiia bacterium]|nr:cupin domain-containing protein [Acidimicrobiia bacterium]
MAHASEVADHPNHLTDRAAETVQAIGARIRVLRGQRHLTLQALADLTGLSASLLSLVERGKTSPSIGTLVSVAHALDIHMNDLLPGGPGPWVTPVTRRADQREFSTPEGVTRRVLKDDRARGLEIAINEYAPGGRSAESSLHHGGYEYGMVIEGTLAVYLDNEKHMLEPGDAIGYDSTRPHRISNESKKRVRALWVNLDRS